MKQFKNLLVGLLFACPLGTTYAAESLPKENPEEALATLLIRAKEEKMEIHFDLSKHPYITESFFQGFFLEEQELVLKNPQEKDLAANLVALQHPQESGEYPLTCLTDWLKFFILPHEERIKVQFNNHDIPVGTYEKKGFLLSSRTYGEKGSMFSTRFANYGMDDNPLQKPLAQQLEIVKKRTQSADLQDYKLLSGAVFPVCHHQVT